MYITLRVPGDSNEWLVKADDQDTVLNGLTGHHPVVLDVVQPVVARLVLAPRAAAGALVIPKSAVVDWVPSYIHLPEARLYLPIDGAVTDHAFGYQLPAGTDLQALEQRLVTAARDRDVLREPVGSGSSAGTLVVNGHALVLAAICPPTVPAGQNGG